MAEAIRGSESTDLMEKLLEITPMTPTIGAVINNVDMSKPCSPDLVAALREALLTHK
ncbi:MAG: alpha-ketoglutarate-dependent taurine dioxygenase, partial [Parvibaculaceae bacterium]